MSVQEDASHSIGNTPLVRLHKLDAGLGATSGCDNLCRNPISTFTVEVGGIDQGALFSEALGDRCADASACTGNQCDLVFKSV